MSVVLAAAPAVRSLPAHGDPALPREGWPEEDVVVTHGVAEQSKKGEDFWIAKCNVERAQGQTFNVYGVSSRPATGELDRHTSHPGGFMVPFVAVLFFLSASHSMYNVIVK